MKQVINRYSDDEGWRWYKLDDGREYISVTTILSNTIANIKLNDWYKRAPAKTIEHISNNARQFGTDVHDIIDCILKDRYVDVPNVYKKHIDSFLKFKHEKNLVAKHSEVMLYSDVYGFAGTTDFIGTVDDKELIADWKITKRYDIKNGWQLGAYRIAAEECLGLQNMGLMGVQIDRETAEVKTFKYKHFDAVQKAFIKSLDVFKMLYFNKLQKLNWPWLLHDATHEYYTRRTPVEGVSDQVIQKI